MGDELCQQIGSDIFLDSFQIFVMDGRDSLQDDVQTTKLTALVLCGHSSSKKASIFNKRRASF
jgi:hypothetical protein